MHLICIKIPHILKQNLLDVINYSFVIVKSRILGLNSEQGPKNPWFKVI